MHLFHIKFSKLFYSTSETVFFFFFKKYKKILLIHFFRAHTQRERTPGKSSQNSLVSNSVLNTVSQKSLYYTFNRLTEALVHAAVVAFSCSLLFHLIIGVLFDCETIGLGDKLRPICTDSA